jgi:hypothetical protein
MPNAPITFNWNKVEFPSLPGPFVTELVVHLDATGTPLIDGHEYQAFVLASVFPGNAIFQAQWSFTAATGGGDGGSPAPITDVPAIATVQPPPDAVDVSLSATVTIVFTNPVDSAQLNFGMIDLSDSDTPYTDWAVDPTVTITPSWPVAGEIVNLRGWLPGTVLHLPTNVEVAFPVGTFFEVVNTLPEPMPITGTLYGPGGSTFSVKGYGTVRFLKVTADAWFATGDLDAS